MSRALVMLLLSWVCIGCAARSPEWDSPPRAAPGVPLRVWSADPSQAATLQRSARTRAVLLATRGGGEPLAREGCQRLRIVEPRRYPDGTAVTAADVVASWETALARSGGAARWLLAPVRGAAAAAAGMAPRIAGLYAADGAVEVCVDHPVPDWEARLRHPELWLDRGVTDDAVVFVDGGGIAASFDAGRVDLAVVYGREAGALDTAGAGARLARLPEWDRTYALWFNIRARWVNDPYFRRWLAGRIDREGMLRYLFEERGSTAFRLVTDGADRPAWVPRDERPFAASSSPRLAISFIRRDRQASDIAARLKAAFESEGLRVDLTARSADDLRQDLTAGRYQVALVSHDSTLSDPVLALTQTLDRLGPGAESALALLEAAARIAPAGRRASGAREAETPLLADARLVPLLRLEAWLATVGTPGGFETGGFGVLRIDAGGEAP